MASVNIQFHMLFDELIEYVNDVRQEHQLEVELERFFGPEAFHTIALSADLIEEIRTFGHVDRIWFIFNTPSYRKPERFMLNVPRLRGNRLAQGQLGAGTNKRAAYDVLKQIALELKRRTNAGVWVISENGSVGYDKNSRVSEGAANAARAGEVELVSIAFTQSFRVDPPETP